MLREQRYPCAYLINKQLRTSQMISKDFHSILVRQMREEREASSEYWNPDGQ